MGKINSKGERVAAPAYLLPLLSGLLLILAFPRFDQGYLAWFALLPLLWFCQHAPPRQAFAGSLLFSLPLHIYLNLYLAGALMTHLPAALALPAFTALIALLCLFYGFFAMAASWARRIENSLTLVFVIPSLWLAMEVTRSIGFLAYNVGYLGYTQWRYPVLLNLTASYGYWGLPLIMVAFQSILVLALCGKLHGKQLRLAVAILALMLLGGITIPEAFRTEPGKQPLWVALIQGDSAPEDILDGTSAGKQKILERYLLLTRQALAKEPRVRLVVWPETVVDLIGRVPAHKREMQVLAAEKQVDMLYGARIFTEDHVYNSAVMLSPGDDEFKTYHKRLLVPFVEYFPLEGPLNKLLNLEFELGLYTPGEETVVFEHDGIPLAAVICFESYFGNYTRLFARDGARHLFVLTNDVWFGATIGKEQHAYAAALRAAESGIGVTQVANSGITISFDYRGGETFRSGKLREEIFTLPLELGSRATPYRYLGDYFPVFWMLYLAVNALIALRRHVRFKKSLKPFD